MLIDGLLDKLLLCGLGQPRPLPPCVSASAVAPGSPPSCAPLSATRRPPLYVANHGIAWKSKGLDKLLNFDNLERVAVWSDIGKCRHAACCLLHQRSDCPAQAYRTPSSS